MQSSYLKSCFKCRVSARARALSRFQNDFEHEEKELHTHREEQELSEFCSFHFFN